jgi:hypothetical protein
MKGRKMILSSVWVCPENASTICFKSDTEKSVIRQAAEDGFSYKRLSGEYATKKTFDLLWKLQSTYDRSRPEIMDKFKKIAMDGRLLFMEVEHE